MSLVTRDTLDLFGLSDEQRHETCVYYATVMHSMIDLFPGTYEERRSYHSRLQDQLDQFRDNLQSDLLYELDRMYEILLRAWDFYQNEHVVHEPLVLKDTPEQKRVRMLALIRIVYVLRTQMNARVIKSQIKHAFKLRRGYLVRLENFLSRTTSNTTCLDEIASDLLCLTSTSFF